MAMNVCRESNMLFKSNEVRTSSKVMVIGVRSSK